MKSFLMYILGISHFTRSKAAKLITPNYEGRDYKTKKNKWVLFGFINIYLSSKTSLGGDTFWMNLISHLKEEADKERENYRKELTHD